MPVLVAGGDSDYASKRDLRIFSLCALIDKRNTSKTQINVIGLSILFTIMASWCLKISLWISCVLLAISIIFCNLCSLHGEKQPPSDSTWTLRSTAWHTIIRHSWFSLQQCWWNTWRLKLCEIKNYSDIRVNHFIK